MADAELLPSLRQNLVSVPYPVRKPMAMCVTVMSQRKYFVHSRNGASKNTCLGNGLLGKWQLYPALLITIVTRIIVCLGNGILLCVNLN